MIDQKILQSFGTYFLPNVRLSEFTHMKTGGVADVIFLPETKTELQTVITKLRIANLPFKIIGGTANILFLDDLNYKILVSTVRCKHISVEQNKIEADCGALLGELVSLAAIHGLGGMEGMEGIPGTVGGAVYMNAGAYGYDVSQTLETVEVLKDDGTVQILDGSELDYSFRHSKFMDQKLGVILKATFLLHPTNRNELWKRQELFHRKRHEYQEFVYPSLGSIFATLDIYSELGKHYPRFKRGIRWRNTFFYRRKNRPRNRIILNQYASRYFNWETLTQSYSDKTLNCLINCGQGTAAMLEYIERIQALTKGQVQLENEIFRG